MTHYKTLAIIKVMEGKHAWVTHVTFQYMVSTIRVRTQAHTHIIYAVGLHALGVECDSLVWRSHEAW